MKKIIAIIAVIILLGLYLITFILAILNKPGSAGLFQASVYATIVIPILFYIYLWLYRQIKEKDKD